MRYFTIFVSHQALKSGVCFALVAQLGLAVHLLSSHMGLV